MKEDMEQEGLNLYKKNFKMARLQRGQLITIAFNCIESAFLHLQTNES